MIEPIWILYFFGSIAVCNILIFGVGLLFSAFHPNLQRWGEGKPNIPK